MMMGMDEEPKLSLIVGMDRPLWIVGMDQQSRETLSSCFVCQVRLRPLVCHFQVCLFGPIPPLHGNFGFPLLCAHYGHPGEPRAVKVFFITCGNMPSYPPTRYGFILLPHRQLGVRPV